MHHDDIQLHNVAELREPDGRDGTLLQRVPESVRVELNEGAQARMRHPAGVELRFVPEGPDPVEVTLSTIPRNGVAEGTVRVFWGPFQTHETFPVGERETIRVSLPERLTRLDPDVADGLAFDPRVCRLVLPGAHRGGHVVYHGADGDLRPPRPEELPDRRYLAYGTSITEGEAPLAEHLTYVNQTARRLGADHINLGSCGTAYCDPAMAEHIAARDDWDVATLALSVNMVGSFSVAEFRERAAHMIDTVAGAHQDDPVAAITIYTNESDVCEGIAEAERSEPYREALREVVAETPHDNVHLLEGPAIVDGVAGLTPDLVHPGDDAMIRMGENLAARLDDLLAE